MCELHGFARVYEGLHTSQQLLPIEANEEVQVRGNQEEKSQMSKYQPGSKQGKRNTGEGTVTIPRALA